MPEYVSVCWSKGLRKGTEVHKTEAGGRQYIHEEAMFNKKESKYIYKLKG